MTTEITDELRVIREIRVPGEGAANIGTSISILYGIFSIPKENSRGYTRELAAPLLYVNGISLGSRQYTYFRLLHLSGPGISKLR